MTVYSGIESISAPEWVSGIDWKEHDKKEKEYVEAIMAWCKENGKGKYAGKEVRFHVADGYARYVVISLSPLRLVHLAVGDAWHFRYVRSLKADAIIDEIERQDAIRKLFS